MLLPSLYHRRRSFWDGKKVNMLHGMKSHISFCHEINLHKFYKSSWVEERKFVSYHLLYISPMRIRRQHTIHSLNEGKITDRMRGELDFLKFLLSISDDDSWECGMKTANHSSSCDRQAISTHFPSFRERFGSIQRRRYIWYSNSAIQKRGIALRVLVEMIHQFWNDEFIYIFFVLLSLASVCKSNWHFLLLDSFLCVGKSIEHISSIQSNSSLHFSYQWRRIACNFSFKISHWQRR